MEIVETIWGPIGIGELGFDFVCSIIAIDNLEYRIGKGIVCSTNCPPVNDAC